MGRRSAACAAVLSTIVLQFSVWVPSASASHRFSFHWARQGSAFGVTLVDSTLTGSAIGILPGVDYQATRAAQGYWSVSGVAQLGYREGSRTATTNTNCPMPPNFAEIRTCTSNYGPNGWAGIANIALDANNHIVSATAKVNLYYSPGGYEYFRHVLCQEIGHALGLDHQNRIGLVVAQVSPSCMATWWDAAGAYMGGQTPDHHDYEELVDIYTGHSDSYGTARCADCIFSSLDSSAAVEPVTYVEIVIPPSEVSMNLTPL